MGDGEAAAVAVAAGGSEAKNRIIAAPAPGGQLCG
jgi:hypothetical protein